MTKKHSMRVIEQLRQIYPELRWSYDREQHVWCSSAGWSVIAKAHLAPRYDGDDDSFVTRYYRDDTGIEVHGVWENYVFFLGLQPEYRRTRRRKVKQ